MCSFMILTLLASSVTAILLAFLICSTPTIPHFEETWWGPGESKIQDTSIRPFQINVSNESLLDLQNRLKNTRKLQKPLEGIQQQYGFNTNTLNRILDYWSNKYDWRTQEKFLNQFPQFQTNIQGLTVHYLHIKPPPETRSLPLLVLHGWPGSVREFYKIIPILTTVHEKYGFAFEVIAPSLPGFAFSEAASKPGLGAIEMGVIFKNLMERIGHRKYYVHGGDWGAVIVTNMATLYPESILGLHTNMPICSGRLSLIKLLLLDFYPKLIVPEKFVHKLFPLKERFQDMLYESGYFHIQSTKPDTIGVGVRDSPAGMAAYILEKFSTLTNPSYKLREDAGLLEKFTYEELIDNLMLYWVTGSFTSASRIYAESYNKKVLELRFSDIPIDVKVQCAVARFPHEIIYQPEWILKDRYSNLIQATDFDEGGHFAALEVPELLAEDIFSAVALMKNKKK